MSINNVNLSVIIPVYNAEATIGRCLESILHQTYQDFEVILVDDGSLDNSYALCEEYAKKVERITVIHIENSGPYQARKVGAKVAKGNILTFSDADDWFEKNAFETAAEIFYKYNPDMLAYTYVCDDDQTERHLYEERMYCNAEIRELILPGMMYDISFGQRRLNPSLSCKWIRKTLFTKVTEGVKDRIIFGDDALVTYPAVCMAECLVICNKALYHYSSNEASCTHLYPLERITEVKVFQKQMIHLFDEMGLLVQMRYQIENYVRSFFAMMIKNWYGIELSPIVYSFPYSIILKGSKVFLYGAGIVGRSYIHELKVTDYAYIAGWADKNYEKLKSYNEIEIIPPHQIKEKIFDTLLIAVHDEKTAIEIKKNLLCLGIPESKIVWIKPIHII